MKPIVFGEAKRAVYGFPPDLPLELPHLVLRHKIRARSNQFARIFIKVADPNDPLITQWEEWYLGMDDKHLFPFMQKGVNKRG